MSQTFTPEQVKKMLGDSMNKFRSSMVGLIRECADVHPYKNMTGGQALKSVADKLEKLS